MKEKGEKLVVDGNAFYEIDLECLQKKRNRQMKKGKKQDAHKTKKRRGGP